MAFQSSNDDYLSDSESTTLIPQSLAGGVTMKRGESQKPDWSRFGLSTEQQQESAAQLTRENPDGEEVFDQHTESEKNELFAEDQQVSLPVQCGGHIVHIHSI